MGFLFFLHDQGFCLRGCQFTVRQATLPVSKSPSLARTSLPGNGLLLSRSLCAVGEGIAGSQMKAWVSCGPDLTLLPRGCFIRPWFEWRSLPGPGGWWGGGDREGARPECELPARSPEDLTSCRPPWGRCVCAGFLLDAAGGRKPSGFHAAQSGPDPAEAWAPSPQGLENGAGTFSLWPARKRPALVHAPACGGGGWRVPTRAPRVRHGASFFEGCFASDPSCVLLSLGNRSRVGSGRACVE